ncbi:MAG: ABC transporter permease [Acidobacteria bacterium]|nr:ABC transporter permease [Acidobacteriota bacterium]MBI3489224.1 ABC transporter permease [Acidobacteriota bacterium]
MLYRLLRLIRKELQVILGDKKTRIMLVMPVLLQTLVFSFAATLEVRNATLAIFNQDGGAASADLQQRLSRTPSFSKLLPVRSEQEARSVMDNQEALVLLRIPADFSRRLAERQTAPLQIVIDGRRSNSAQIAMGYVSQVIQAYTLERGVHPSSHLLSRNIYNPNLDSKWHVLPSLVALITTIGCLTVTALSVAREREEGTFDQLLVSPLTPAYIMAGKAVPGILVALVQGGIIVSMAIFGFGIPFSGSLPLLLAGLTCYGLALAGVGLFISSISSTQQQAFLGVFAFMAPAVNLSGYVAPIENMPRFFQVLAYMNPLTYCINIVKGVFLKGYGFGDALPDLWPLLLIAFGTLSLALYMFRRHIA